MAAPLVYMLAGAAGGHVLEKATGAVESVYGIVTGGDSEEGGPAASLTGSVVAAAAGATLAYWLTRKRG